MKMGASAEGAQQHSMYIRLIKPFKMRQALTTIVFPLFILITHAQKACSYSIDTIRANYKSNLDSILSKLDTTTLVISHNKKDIPSIIKKEIKCLNSSFAIANTGEKYLSTDIHIGHNLPTRQLIFMAKGKNFFMMTYNHGGIGWHQHILFVQFTGDSILHFWTSQAVGNLNSAADVLFYIKQVRAGKVRWFLDDQLNHI